MGVAFTLARAGVRRRLAGLAGLAVLIALGVGIAVAAFEAADRTERAYPAYLRDADVADLVVNPGLSTVRVEEIIAATPGVESYTTHDFLNVTADTGAPRLQAEVDAATVPVLMSTDGRFIDTDRPIVRRGRMIEGGLEAFLSADGAEWLGVDVGDQLPLAFWQPSYVIPGVGPQPDDRVEPFGRTTVEVVGIGTFADEVLADDLYPQAQVLITPEVGEAYTCAVTLPSIAEQRPLTELVDVMNPPPCALNYRYFALQLADGEAGVGPVTDHLQAQFELENAQIPTQLREYDVGYGVIPTATRDQRERVANSLAPAVASLRIFGLVAAGSTVIVAVLLAVRMQRRDQRDAATWRYLGMTAGQRLVAIGGPFVVAVLAGVVGAAVIGWLGSRFGPVASARNVEPDAGMALSARAALPVLGGTLVVLLGGVLLGAIAVIRVKRSTRRARLSVVARAVSTAAPPKALGIRAATNGVGAGAVLVGSVTAIGVVLASLVFSTSMERLVDEPARYGWPYDAAVMVGYGYGGADEVAIGQTLDAHPDVERWGIAALGTVTVDGESLAGVSARRGFEAIGLPVDAGRLPSADDEVAIGITTADELGIEVGDDVTVSNSFGERQATVTGTVVLPPIGPYESDRAATGTGVLLSQSLAGALIADGEAAAGLEPGSLERTGLGSFVGIELRDGVDADAFLADIADDLPSWDQTGLEPQPFAQAVRPAAIADVDGMRAVPVALGAFFALTMAGALAIGLTVVTRGRRRELALLRALGSSSRDLSGSVRWHALTIVGIALLFGVPLGIAAGRTLYRLFALDLGIVPVPAASVGWVLVVCAVAVGIALLAAVGPGRAVANQPAAEVLRSE